MPVLTKLERAKRAATTLWMPPKWCSQIALTKVLPCVKLQSERASRKGLIHYHFKTKEDLFEAMVARRTEHINGQRMRLLADLFDISESPSLESIVETLFRPTSEAGISRAGGGGAFA
jgi:hypothetical protein